MPGHAIDIVHVSVERGLETMRTMAAALERLDSPARRRVLRWLDERYRPTLFEDE